MNLLLDTCTFLWIVSDSRELSKRCREMFSTPENDVFLSPVSAWEIVVKHALGRLPLPEPPSAFIPKHRKAHGIQPLDLGEEAVMHLSRLPEYHKDPFDRVLVCQAIAHGMAILTPDGHITQYPVRTVW